MILVNSETGGELRGAWTIPSSVTDSYDLKFVDFEPMSELSLINY